MKKKILSMLLSVSMVLSLVACSSSSTEDASKDAIAKNEQKSSNVAAAGKNKNSGDYVYQDLEDAEFTFFQYSVEGANAYQEAIESYEAIHPNITINLESVGGATDWTTVLKGKISSGDEPTLIAFEGASDFDTFGDMIDDLSDQPWVKHVYSSVLNECTVDGKIVALPGAIVDYGLLYNKKIFKACGIDGDKLRTYDDIEAAFAKIKDAIKNGDLAEEFPLLEEVVTLPAAETWVLVNHASNIALGKEFSSPMDAYNAASINFNYSDAFKDYIDLMVKYTSDAENPSALTAVDYDTSMGGGFCIERAAVIQMGQWVYSMVKEADGVSMDDIGLLPMPLKGVDEDNICYGVGQYLVTNKNSTEPQKAAAKDFLNWLYMSDDGKNLITNVLAGNVPFDNYGDYQISNQIAAAGNVYAEEGNITPLVGGAYPDGWMDSFGAGLQSYIAGKAEWDDVIEDAKESWTALR